MAELISSASRARASAWQWLDEQLGSISFRLRLLRMALRRLDNIPAAVVMALETPGYDALWPSDHAETTAAPDSEATR
jgi:hypothetical protein